MFRLRDVGLLVALLSLTLTLGCGDRDRPTAPADRAASVSISPDSARVPVDDTTTLTATVRDENGDPVEDVSVDWFARDTGVVDLDDSGHLEALALRKTEVYAAALGDTGRAVVVGAPAPTEEMTPVDSTELDLTSGVEQRSQGIYEFEVRGGGDVSIEEGQVVVGAQGPGFLRRVTGVSRSGDVLRLQTEQARLTDAVKAGELHVDMSLDPSASARTVSGVHADLGPNVVASRTVHLSPTRVEHTAKGVTVNDDGSLAFGRSFGGADISISFDGKVEFKPETEAHLAWNKKKFPLSGVDSIHVSVGDTAVLAAEAELSAGAAASMEREVNLATFSRDFVTTIGPVPVKGRVRLRALLGTRVTANAKATLSSGRAVLRQNVFVTARYKNGAFSFPTDFSNSFEKPQPSFSSSAKVEARPYVRTDVAVVLYEVIGPEVGPEPYLEGVGEVHRDGPNHCENHAGIYGGLDVRAAVAWGKAGEKVKNLLNIKDIEKYIEGPRAELAETRWYCKGDLEVTTSTGGSGGDADGYTVAVGDEETLPVGMDETRTLTDLRTGDREVALEDVNSNCSVKGDNPRTVTVYRSKTASDTFSVQCADEDADLTVHTSTTGTDIDPDGYTVTVDDSVSHSAPSNGSATFSQLAEGSHRVELTGVADNCTVSGSNPRSVEITTDSLSSTTYDVSCERSLTGRIVFSSERDDEQGDLYRVAPDGSNVVRLTDNSVSDGSGAIAPDGDDIAWEHDGNLWVMNADGSGKTEVASSAYSDFNPAWSPDADQLVFTSYRTANNELYRIDADGSDLTRLTHDSNSSEYKASWSPDGDRIAFTAAYRDDAPGDIYLIDPDGTDLGSVTDTTIQANHVEWSPDGDRLVFSASLDEAFNDDIYVINADGTGLTRLTTSDAGDYFPTWSPDGSKIAFASNRGKSREIWVMDADGTDQFKITDNDDYDDDPHWGPKP